MLLSVTDFLWALSSILLFICALLNSSPREEAAQFVSLGTSSNYWSQTVWQVLRTHVHTHLSSSWPPGPQGHSPNWLSHSDNDYLSLVRTPGTDVSFPLPQSRDIPEPSLGGSELPEPGAATLGPQAVGSGVASSLPPGRSSLREGLWSAPPLTPGLGQVLAEAQRS